MEAVFLILIGAALFSQSWNLMGLYSDGRTTGIFVGGLGLLSLVALVLDPMLLTGDDVKAANHLAEITATKVLVVMWALYCVGVAAQAIWDLEDRSIGFFGLILAIASVVVFLYYATTLEARYSEGAWLGLSLAGLLLSIMAGMVFFAFGFTFNVMRAVASWFLLLGGATVGVIGLAIISQAI